MKPILQFFCLSCVVGFAQLRASEATVNEGSKVVLSYGLGAGTPPFTHQWLKDGQPIPGATLPTYTIDLVKAADAGNYSIKVANRAGETVSDLAAITVVVKPARIVTKIASETTTTPIP